MLFILLLCSLFFFNNALPLSNVNVAHHSLLEEVLEHKNGPEAEKNLLDIVDKLDPASIQIVIKMIQELLTISRNDLDRLTTAASTANTAFDDANNAHNSALVAQINGVTAAELLLSQGTSAADADRTKIVEDLTAAHDQTIVSLQADVDNTLASKNTATTAKTFADSSLAADESRLNAEIQNLWTVIEILSNVKKIQVSLDDLFVIDDFTGNYDAGVAHCAGMTGGNYKVASVHNDEENDQLFSQINNRVWSDGENRWTFLGAVETSVNSVWEWSDGSAWDYTPKNDGLNNPSETRMIIYSDGVWHDINDQTKSSIACRLH